MAGAESGPNAAAATERVALLYGVTQRRQMTLAQQSIDAENGKLENGGPETHIGL